MQKFEVKNHAPSYLPDGYEWEYICSEKHTGMQQGINCWHRV